MSARANSFKHYPHIFSPMQMIYNYANNIKSSIGDFFRQYLKPEGKEVLLLFNRYMLIAIFLNVDVKLFFALCILVYIVIKLLKIRPWVKERHVNMPLSYVNALYEYRKKEEAIKTRKNQQKDDQQSDPSFVSQKSSSLTKQCRMPILCVEEKQQMLKMINNQPQIGYFTASHIEQYIYTLINNVTQSYCSIVWYLKWKSIGMLWIITGLIYMFEPSNQYDTFKIKTKKDGALQIGQISKASEIINYFHLIFICILTNIILFYFYGTRQLRNQLLLEVYTREYSINFIKNRRIRTIRSSMNAESKFAYDSQKPLSEEPGSPMLFCTVVDKGRIVDLEELKNFASSEQKFLPKIQVPDAFSQRKFSHDVPIIHIETPPKKSIKNSTNKQIEELLQRSRVNSQEEIEQESIEENQPSTKILPEFSQKSSQTKNQNQTNYDTSVKFDPIGSLITQTDAKRGPILQKKNIFLSGNGTQNLLGSKSRKTSDQIKINQFYTDFRISLFKVEPTKKQTRKNR